MHGERGGVIVIELMFIAIVVIGLGLVDVLGVVKNQEGEEYC